MAKSARIPVDSAELTNCFPDIASETSEVRNTRSTKYLNCQENT